MPLLAEKFEAVKKNKGKDEYGEEGMGEQQDERYKELRRKEKGETGMDFSKEHPLNKSDETQKGWEENPLKGVDSKEINEKIKNLFKTEEKEK